MVVGVDVAGLFVQWLEVRDVRDSILTPSSARISTMIEPCEPNRSLEFLFNFIFHACTQEWKAEAAGRGLKTQHTFGRAARSLREYTGSVICGADVEKVHQRFSRESHA